MGELKTVVFSASIDNEQALRQWVDSVGEAAQRARTALDELSDWLRRAPHISITLRQHEPSGEA